MARPRFTTDASRDLKEIVRYISAWDLDAAMRLADQLEAQCWQLARDPRVGQLRPDLGRGIRFFPFGNYLIFYRENVEGIQVIRVLHGARSYGSMDF